MSARDLHGSGWTPRSDDRDAAIDTATSSESSTNRQVVQRTRRFIRLALMVLLATVVAYASVRVVSDGATLVRRLQSSTSVPHGGNKKIVLSPSALRLGPNVHVKPPRTTQSLVVSIGLSLTADLLAGFALWRLWKNRRLDLSPSRLRDRIRLRRPADQLVLVGMLAVFVAVSAAGLVWSISVGRGMATMLASPLMLVATAMLIRFWRREHRVLTGEVRGTRLWCHDERGNSLPPVPLQFRRAVQPCIAEGDRVEVRGYWNERRKVLQVQSARNLTTCLKIKRFSMFTTLGIPGLLMLGASRLAMTPISALHPFTPETYALWMAIGLLGRRLEQDPAGGRQQACCRCAKASL